MEQEIFVPDLGDYHDVEVIEVLVKPGDNLKKDDTIITLETDKATMDLPAPMDLVINKVYVAPGDRVSKGSLMAKVIAIVGNNNSSITKDLNDQNSDNNHNKHDNKYDNKANLDNNDGFDKLRSSREFASFGHNISTGLSGFANASPGVRKFARELGVDLNNVVGTYKQGRISEENVKEYVRNVLTTNLKNLNATNNIDFNKWGSTTQQPLSRIKKRSGQHLHKNWLSIPHVTHFETVDFTELENFRKEQQKAIFGSQDQNEPIKLTPLAFFVKAVANSLQNFCNFNSSLSSDGEFLIVKSYYNIGIAVDTPAGLVVPVIKNVDQKNIRSLAKELQSISKKAREGKLTAEDLQGGCFSISSLGGIGGSNFTPIINAPEVAILGVSRSKILPHYIDGELKPRLILPLALSYDHRVIDGAEAAKFSNFIVQQLEDPKNFYE